MGGLCAGLSSLQHPFDQVHVSSRRSPWRSTPPISTASLRLIMYAIAAEPRCGGMEQVPGLIAAVGVIVAVGAGVRLRTELTGLLTPCPGSRPQLEIDAANATNRTST